jgi:hypothetical protein
MEDFEKNRSKKSKAGILKSGIWLFACYKQCLN